MSSVFVLVWRETARDVVEKALECRTFGLLPVVCLCLSPTRTGRSSPCLLRISSPVPLSLLPSEFSFDSGDTSPTPAVVTAPATQEDAAAPEAQPETSPVPEGVSEHVAAAAADAAGAIDATSVAQTVDADSAPSVADGAFAAADAASAAAHAATAAETKDDSPPPSPHKESSVDGGSSSPTGGESRTELVRVCV